MFRFIETLIAAGCSHIVEANFYPSDATKFLKIQARHPFQPFQIYCCITDALICSRFRARTESGQRHPGHVDQEAIHELADCEKRNPALEIGGALYRLDTTDFSKIDYAHLSLALNSARRSTDG